MCSNNKVLKKTKITHKYKECGLENVILVGVDFHRCNQCGEEYYGFGSIDKLHETIASVLLQKKDFLSGSEVRFLRKYLGYSATVFAKIIGYDDATLSRLETEAQPITRAFDRLIRFTVASKLPSREYDLHDQILNNTGIVLNQIELTSNSQGKWQLKKLKAA